MTLYTSDIIAVGSPRDIVPINNRFTEIGDILNGNIATENLAAGAVLSANIGNSEVKTANINNLAVTAAKIANSTITATQLADDAVTSGKIATSAVTSDGLAANSVVETKITDFNVTMRKLSKTGMLWSDRLTADTSQAVVANVVEEISYLNLSITPTVDCRAVVTGLISVRHSNSTDTPTMYAGLFLTTDGVGSVKIDNSMVGNTRAMTSASANVAIPIHNVINLNAGVAYIIHGGFMSNYAGTVTFESSCSLSAVLYPR
jgi:hypothetical protein